MANNTSISYPSWIRICVAAAVSWKIFLACGPLITPDGIASGLLYYFNEKYQVTLKPKKNSFPNKEQKRDYVNIEPGKTQLI
jgi:hypothetical protein